LELKFPGKKIFQRPGNEAAETESNTPLTKIDPIIENGQDETPTYELPKFQPYIWVITRRIELPKKK